MRRGLDLRVDGVRSLGLRREALLALLEVCGDLLIDDLLEDGVALGLDLPVHICAGLLGQDLEGGLHLLDDREGPRDVSYTHGRRLGEYVGGHTRGAQRDGDCEAQGSRGG